MQNVQPGDTATLTAKTTFAGPLQYQWRHYSDDLPGQTNQTLTLSSVTTTNTGEYTVIVRDALGVELGVQFTGRGAPARAAGDPQDPQSQILAAGTNLFLSVEIVPNTGQVSYQWFKNDVPLTAPACRRCCSPTRNPAMAVNYFVVITNSIGSTTSTVAAVTIIRDAKASPAVSAGTQSCSSPSAARRFPLFNGASTARTSSARPISFHTITNAKLANVGQYFGCRVTDFGIPFTNSLPPLFIDPTFTKRSRRGIFA